MLIDSRTQLCSNVGVTTGAGSGIGDVIDLGVGRDIGNGQPLYLVVQITEDITHATTGTMSFTLDTDDNSSMSSATTIGRSVSVATSTSASAVTKTKAGSIFWATALPIEGQLVERYLRMSFASSSSHATGKISAFLTTDVAAWKAYADAVN